MSDIHVMAPQLLEKRGTAFDNYLSQDPKLLEYSGDELEYLVAETLKRNPDLVIIPGDLTKDGELVSHQLVVSILSRLRNAGIPVIVVPRNHDIDNPEGYYFNGDNTRPAERTSPEQFKTLYADFGYNQAYAKDPASLSFVCEPLEGLVLLCIDTNKYEENLYLDKGDAKDYNQTSGRIRPATLTWMLGEADKARASKKQVVLVQHHNIVQHYDAQTTMQGAYIVDDYVNVSKQLMDHGVHMAFTGHTHLQDIAQYRTITNTAQPDSLVDVATGSVISYPNPWRTFKGERVMGIDNRIQTAVILPSVLHLHHQILFVMKLCYVHFSMLFYLNSFKYGAKLPIISVFSLSLPSVLRIIQSSIRMCTSFHLLFVSACFVFINIIFIISCFLIRYWL